MCACPSALAGNTPRIEVLWLNQAVHPRARGEHAGALVGEETAIGSSPRSRGTRIPRLANHIDSRFIPALAGNTEA